MIGLIVFLIPTVAQASEEREECCDCRFSAVEQFSVSEGLPCDFDSLPVPGTIQTVGDFPEHWLSNLGDMPVMRPRMHGSVVIARAQTCLIGLALCCCAACSASDHDRVAIEASLADISTDPLEFYATQSPTTEPGEFARMLAGVPANAEGIVRTVQGVLVRVDAVESEAYPISERRVDREVNIATVRGMLARIVELDDRSLTAPRPPQDRLVGICAQHAMLTTALFRHHGIAARARGGFETYFSATRHHDHWITEYWDAETARWVRVDAEIEKHARFDGLDLPDGSFLTGTDAWLLCRSEGKSPSHFGISGGKWIGGWDFVMNELLLDFNALNKVESLPWDEMKLTGRGYEALTARELSLLDRMAETVLEGDAAFERIRDLFRSNPELRKPAA